MSKKDEDVVSTTKEASSTDVEAWDTIAFLKDKRLNEDDFKIFRKEKIGGTAFLRKNFLGSEYRLGQY